MSSEDLLEATSSPEVGDKDTLNLDPAPTKREETYKFVEWVGRELATAKPHVDKFREAAKECYKFRDGHQISEADEKKLKSEGRPNTAFNSTQKYIRYVTGIERYAPEALIFSAINESDELAQAYGEFATRCYDWAIAKANGDYERSEAFGDLIVCGMGWCDAFISRTRDPRGLPRMPRLDPLEMLWPQSKVPNLGGAEADPGTRWRARESWIDKDEAISRWPEKEIEIDIAAGSTSGDRPERDKVTHTIRDVATVPIESKDASADSSHKNKVKILEFQWYDEEEGFYFFDPLEKDDTWMDKRTFAIYKNRLPKMTKGQYKVTDWMRQSKRIFYKRFLLNRRHVLGEKLRMPGDLFAFNCMTSYYDPEDEQWYGYVRLLVDPQKYANKFFAQVLEIMGHQTKGGLDIEDGAILAKDVKGFERDRAKPGTVSVFAPGAIKDGRIKDKQLPQLPDASMRIVDFCLKSQENVTGIDPDQFGQGNSNTPGVTMRQKQKAGLILLAQEFDSLSRFRKDEGKIVLQHLAILADDRLIKVGGPMPGEGQVLKLIREPFNQEYDLMLDDTERDPNIRRMYEENVMTIAPTLIRMGWFLPELLDWFRLPWWFKQKLKQAIMQKSQKDQQMQMMGMGGKGRGANKSVEERQAGVAKLKADTMVQQARADRILGQRRRDEVKTLLEIVSTSLKGKIDREQHNTEQAQRALELFDAATGRMQESKRRSLPSPGGSQG